MPTFVATSGPLSGQRFEIDRELTLGREGDLLLPEEEASRRHATVRPEGRGAVIEDLGSLNGTFVDGRRIDVATTLTGGERIRIGSCEFELEADPEPAPVAADPGATRLHTPPPADDATVIRDRPAPADPGATTVRPRPEPADPGATTVRRRPDLPPPPPPPPPPAPQPAAPAPARAPAASAGAPAEPFGALAPRGGKPARRSRGAATRLLAPAFASYAVIVLTAVALVLYFASR